MRGLGNLVIEIGIEGQEDFHEHIEVALRFNFNDFHFDLEILLRELNELQVLLLRSCRFFLVRQLSLERRNAVHVFCECCFRLRSFSFELSLQRRNIIRKHCDFILQSLLVENLPVDVALLFSKRIA